MKTRIRLETITDIGNFILAVSVATNSPVYVTDGKKMCISGTSFLGLVHAREFAELYCECDQDIYSKIKPFVIEEDQLDDDTTN